VCHTLSHCVTFQLSWSVLVCRTLYQWYWPGTAVRPPCVTLHCASLQWRKHGRTVPRCGGTVRPVPSVAVRLGKDCAPRGGRSVRRLRRGSAAARVSIQKGDIEVLLPRRSRGRCVTRALGHADVGSRVPVRFKFEYTEPATAWAKLEQSVTPGPVPLDRSAPLDRDS
jgi:hypothetical protein